MEMWVCGEDVKNYWRVKWISKTFRIVYSDSVRKQMDCECMDVCVCRQGCLGASAWTYAHRGRRRASIRGMVVQALGMRIRIRKACHSRGTISWRERRSRRSIVSLPSVLFLFSFLAIYLFLLCCLPFLSVLFHFAYLLFFQERESMTLFYLRLRMCTLTHTGACAYI